MYELRMIKTDEIITSDYNPRVALKKGNKEYEKLKNSILDLGLIDPFVWNEQTGRLVSGHQRLQVCKDNGIAEVPCFVVHLSDEKERQANIALNKINGRFDSEKLDAILSDLDPSVVMLAGFDSREIRSIEPMEMEFTSREYGEEEFGNDKFEYECPNCGFRFTP